MGEATVHFKRTVVAKGGKADLLVVTHEELRFKNMEVSIQSESNGERVNIVIRPSIAPHGKPPAARPERYWIKKLWDLFFATIKTTIETIVKILL